MTTSLWTFDVLWDDVSEHDEEAYEAVVNLPSELDAYAVINIGRGPEFGGHSILIYDKEDFGTHVPLAELHSNRDLPAQDQVVAAVAALVQWVKEALYLYELNELDPSGEFYVR